MQNLKTYSVPTTPCNHAVSMKTYVILGLVVRGYCFFIITIVLIDKIFALSKNVCVREFLNGCEIIDAILPFVLKSKPKQSLKRRDLEKLKSISVSYILLPNPTNIYNGIRKKLGSFQKIRNIIKKIEGNLTIYSSFFNFYL